MQLSLVLSSVFRFKNNRAWGKISSLITPASAIFKTYIMQAEVITGTRKTEILPVDPGKIGRILLSANSTSSSSASLSSVLDDWDIEWNVDGVDITHLQAAATRLRESDIPVAFPTETVYGLAADATRSSAVQGIYHAKQRPSDNPLIVHVHSLKQLRSLLDPTGAGGGSDAIPAIYNPLITRFWPGPLTIILPNPSDSILAPEVTAGLDTFGARMPRSLLALALIKLAGRPLAAPSANASTKPSPTTAEHVQEDMDGRIEVIIDGGPCAVGLESTVVDGLTSPPAILRPGGLSIEQIRQCSGWENVTVAYKQLAEADFKPRAPGMKYRHYSPKAPVVLYEHGLAKPSTEDIVGRFGHVNRVGFIRTRLWGSIDEDQEETHQHPSEPNSTECIPSISSEDQLDNGNPITAFSDMLQSPTSRILPHTREKDVEVANQGTLSLWEINIGNTVEQIARALFAALRELDKKNVDIILVEGVDDTDGDIAAAIMNRLRKAAETVITKTLPEAR